MTHLTRSVISLSIATGLALAGTGVASAQSSNLLGSSAFSSSSSKDSNGTKTPTFEGRHDANTLEGQFERSYAQALYNQGLQPDAELDAFAIDVADRLANGELPYEEGRYTLTWEFSADGQYAAEITRLSLAEAQSYALILDNLLEGLLAGKNPENDRLGYAVASDEDYIYLVVSGPSDLAPDAEIEAAAAAGIAF